MARLLLSVTSGFYGSWPQVGKVDRVVALNGLLVASTINIFLGPMWGALSDRIGRRVAPAAPPCAATLELYAPKLPHHRRTKMNSQETSR